MANRRFNTQVAQPRKALAKGGKALKAVDKEKNPGLAKLPTKVTNRLYNKQVSPKGYKDGGRVKKMGGGMMKKRTMMKAGSNGKLKMVMKGGKKVPFFAADGKGAKDLGKAKMMKGGRVKKMGGGISKLNPGLQAFMKKKMKKKM